MEKIKKAIILANITAVALVIIKVVTWILTWSLAVLSSALDSMMDFFVSLFNLYILKRSSNDHDETYNYWHWKIQWIWAVFEWAVVWFSGLALIYFAIQKILWNKWVEEVDISIYMMIVSIIITWWLVWYLKKVSSDTNNLTLKADTLHYQTDLWTNLWIIFSLILIKITWLEILDSVVSIMIWWYII
jgi:cation diffusion facilitator family transporter